MDPNIKDPPKKTGDNLSNRKNLVDLGGYPLVNIQSLLLKMAISLVDLPMTKGMMFAGQLLDSLPRGMEWPKKQSSNRPEPQLGPGRRGNPLTYPAW